MDIYLIRHPKIDNFDNRCYGHYEMKLSSDFNEVAERLKVGLEVTSTDCVYSSPSERCEKLAGYLSKTLVCIDSRLRELSFGEWEYKKWDEINQVELNLWMDNYVEKSPPEGESFTDLYIRSVQAFKEAVSENGKNVFIITHAGVIRSILAYILEIKLEKTFQIKVDYAGVTRISFVQNRFCIEYLNKTYV